jgi:hypothetical protein
MTYELAKFRRHLEEGGSKLLEFFFIQVTTLIHVDRVEKIADIRLILWILDDFSELSVSHCCLWKLVA